MIAHLKGQILEKHLHSVIIDVSGVGYEVICTLSCLAGLSEGESASIIIHTDVKEDSIRLYGFSDFLEKQIFLLLVAVKGVGAKSGTEILSQIDCRALLRIIGGADVTALTRLKGIGKKTAERIIVELKDKVSDFAVTAGHSSPLKVETIRYDAESSSDTEDAVAALEALGFPQAEARAAVQSALQQEGTSNLPVGEIVKEALRYV